MIVTAWNNGAHNRNGSGYGIKISNSDRDAFFKPEWDSIVVEIEDDSEPVEIKINQATFWAETNRELTSAAVGKWLRKNGLAPWPQGKPPIFILEPIEGNRFKIAKAGGKVRPTR